MTKSGLQERKHAATRSLPHCRGAAGGHPGVCADKRRRDRHRGRRPGPLSARRHGGTRQWHYRRRPLDDIGAQRRLHDFGRRPRGLHAQGDDAGVQDNGASRDSTAGG